MRSSRNIPTIAAACCLALATSLSAQSDKNYNFHLEEPIPVKNQAGQDLLLVGMQGSLVTFSFPSDRNMEASIPIEEDPKLKFTFSYPDNFSDIQFNVLNGNFDQALRQIRNPPIDLLRFLAIPEPKCNFHLYGELYYRALAYAGPPEQSLAATKALPWKSPNLPAIFIQHADALLNRMVSNKEIETTEALLTVMRENLPVTQFSSIALPVADKLRIQGENELVESIYDALSQSSDPDVRMLGQMWTAYNMANTGRIDAAKAQLEKIGEVAEDSPLFSVYCLAHGRLALSEKNTVQALRFLSRAMVRTTIADSYKPEIYFLMIKSYMMVENTVPATRLAKEMAVFYPSNMWRKSIMEEYPSIEEMKIELKAE